MKIYDQLSSDQYETGTAWFDYIVVKCFEIFHEIQNYIMTFITPAPCEEVVTPSNIAIDRNVLKILFYLLNASVDIFW